jgi:2-dehydro-3-deoxyphosphooctonate aldolase (KDO 8-P synthase)
MTREIKIGSVVIGGGNPIVLIAGPCVIESEDSTLFHASQLQKITSRLGIPFIFKSSYNKANRTSKDSYRGPGLKAGLKILKKVKTRLGIPVLSDVHCQAEVDEVKEVLDVIQVPAFLSRQTDLITSVAKTGKAVNVKKGQFLAPWDIQGIIDKITAAGNDRILITERGVSFGYNNLVSDLRALPIMRGLGWPVIYDATHSVQLPGGRGSSSGGDRKFVIGLSRASAAMGCDGLFIEVHKNPREALCDGPNMVPLAKVSGLLNQVKRIDEIVRQTG